MKRILSIMVMLLFLAFTSATSLADTGPCVQGELDSNGVRTYSWKLVDTNANGIVTGDYCKIVSGYIVGVRLLPDDVASLVISGDYQPSDNWDGEVQDQYGYDVIEGVGSNVTNLFTTTRQYRTPITTDGSGNEVGLIYISGVKLRGYASGLGNNNGCKIEISIKEQASVRSGR